MGERAGAAAESDFGEAALSDLRLLIKRVQKTKQGFTDIKKAAEEVFAAGDPAEIFDLAKESYFRERPEHAIRLLSRMRADESEYVRKSAGNALRDISRKHADLIRAELGAWDLSDGRVRQTHQLAGRFLKQLFDRFHRPKPWR